MHRPWCGTSHSARGCASGRPVHSCLLHSLRESDVAVLYDPQIRNVMSELRGDVMIAVYALYCFPNSAVKVFVGVARFELSHGQKDDNKEGDLTLGIACAVAISACDWLLSSLSYVLLFLVSASAALHAHVASSVRIARKARTTSSNERHDAMASACRSRPQDRASGRSPIFEERPDRCSILAVGELVDFEICGCRRRRTAR